MSEDVITVPQSVATGLKWTWLITGRILSMIVAIGGIMAVVVGMGIPNFNTAPIGTILGFILSRGLILYFVYKGTTMLWSKADTFNDV